MGRIIAIANQKGGVGKTTTSVNLSACLADAGKKVLLVDLDPQGNASSGLGIEKDDLELCVHDVLIDGEPIADIVQPTMLKKLFVAPATIQLAGAEVELVSVVSRETMLKKALAPVRDEYDFIIIDCPPSLGLLTLNAFTAADSVLIPMEPEYYAADGLMELLKVYSAIKAKFNPDLKIEGIVFTFDTPTFNNSKRNKKAVISTYGDKIRIFKESIPRAVTIAETASEGISIFAYDGSGKGAQSYQKLVEGVLDHA